MPRTIDEKNRRARRRNPTAGIPTGNPQLAAHEGKEVRSPPGQRPPRKRGRGTVRVEPGERRGG